MRIVSGSAKGKRLRAPRGLKTRPTLGRARQALFDILSPSLPRARFLDLFAGTGSIGIEALSRGAESAVFVEQDERVALSIRDNLAHVGMTEKGRILRMTVPNALKRLAQAGGSFDIIFADPPYGDGWIPRVLGTLEAHRELLRPNGQFIAQQHHKEPVIVSEYFIELRDRKIGDTRFVFYGFRGTS